MKRTGQRGMNVTAKLCPHLKISHNENLGNFVATADIFACIVNSVFIIPSGALNLALLLSIIKSPSLRKPSYILICCLAVTDFVVAVLVQPLFIARKVALLYRYQEAYCFLLKAGNVVSHIVCSPSFFVVTAISIDRYFAIRLQTRYKQVMTNRKVYKIIFACIIGSCLVTLGRFNATKPEHMAYAAALMFILLMIIVYCYIKSLKTLQAHQIHIKNIQTSSQGYIQTILHKRTLKTLLMIVAILFFCFSPFVTVVIVISKCGRNRVLTVAWEVTVTLVYLNSFLNPLLHLYRCKQLRQACIGLLQRNKIGILVLYKPRPLEFQTVLQKASEVLDERGIPKSKK